jgi:phosphoribosylaminoimidazolecarboxamide formyltransferase/IMP cyclohydrolase
MNKLKTALISVSDKTGLPEFARQLTDLGVTILSTGGTANLLRDNDIDVTDVSDYTHFPEILDGRVKTLHPKIHGGLLALRDKHEHREELEKHGIKPIDMVVVNLYPFEQTIAKPGVELMEAVENIDIGGPTMIRSAAKNYTNVAVVTSPGQYGQVADELQRNDGHIRESFLYDLALAAFRHTAHYDAAISQYLSKIKQKPDEHEDVIMLELHKKQELRYGENPHQTAAFYVDNASKEPSIGNAIQVGGPALSFNNIIDINGALELVKEFDRPAAACIKHTNPCGAGIADSIGEAYRLAYEGDPLSAFGCIVALNRPFDCEVAEKIAGYRIKKDGQKLPYFVEAIIAPEIRDDAKELLLQEAKWAERTRLLETGRLSPDVMDKQIKDMRKVVGGMLVQDRDLYISDLANSEVATERSPSPAQMEDLKFAWTCCKHVKSNAITLVKDGMIVGTGAGQMSRVDATEAALRKAGERAKGAVMASDAFFPFPDAIEIAAKAGITAVVQPGGAKGDERVAKTANDYGISMIMTGNRHFLH